MALTKLLCDFLLSIHLHTGRFVLRSELCYYYIGL